MATGSRVFASETFLPEDVKTLAPVLSFLEAHDQVRGDAAHPSYALVGVGEHDRIELPENLHHVLTRVVAAMVQGRAVTVAPQSMTLTTQQAADLLGVSRPTVVRLITDGHIAAERVGNRHRLLLDDVLAYRDARRTRQYDAIAATSVPIDAEEDPDVVRKQLRDARTAVAARRRAARQAG
ncbi:helix-turn-helix domain-containing protein (plasmid) [Gordonia polyisoprenivorans]|uniref:helix-turn-helix domain-containing protein n=1 Tax=Gordonia polyisoprenivorans TaxID=84595 RepID=UPI002234A385|nr:helix-turn-helix domain-containing protein [uncultured Gordonia sp.]UZF59340.1 helix-turn-helix domain-containing protein [Gordonia polyisoprenivorans]